MRRSTRTGCVMAGAIVLATAGLAIADGNVTAVVKSGNLVLVGDAGGNAVTIDQAGLGASDFRVTPDGDTTVNSGTTAVVLSGVSKGLIAKLGDGANVLT